MVNDVELKSEIMYSVMNLIEAEAHSRFSFLMTKNEKYLEELKFFRELRTAQMSEIVKEEDSQLWCLSKHILSSAMRSFEAGDKIFSLGDKEKSKKYYEWGYSLLEHFFNLNFESANIGFLSKIADRIRGKDAP
jgi:hypothetical protein